MKRDLLIIFVLVFFASSCASKSKQVDSSYLKKEVLPQHKQEVTAIYKECLEYKHGVMLSCVQNKVNELGEEVIIFSEINVMNQNATWVAPEEYIQRENTLEADKSALVKGKEIYGFYCSACHGIDAKGRAPDIYFDRKVADLTNPKLLQRKDGELFWKITEGSWPMPAFWEGDVLTENDIWALIHYLRTIDLDSAEENN